MNIKTDRSYLKNIIPLLILFILVITAFIRFMNDNRERITHQNEVYLEDLTMQRAAMIDNLFTENLNYIQSTAFLYGESIESSEPDYELLRRFEQQAGFEMLRFIDSNGNDHTGEGIAANVADREYFILGMAGNTGITYVLTSRVTNETQIGFYSPVYYNNEIIGIMVGFYGEDYINKLISFELFGCNGEGWLCLSDGTVLGTTSQKTDEAENIITGGLAYTAPLKQTDWVLIRAFPPEAAEQMLKNANKEGIELLIILVALFAIYSLFLVIRFIRQRRHILEESHKAYDISNGVSRLFEKFQTVDFADESYSYIYGMPDDKSLDINGKYKDFYNMLLSRIQNEDERDAASKFLSLDNLKELFSKGGDMLSIRLHAPINGNEWFTYNFVALERENNEIRRMLIMRQDITDLHKKEEQEQAKLKKAYEEADKANKAKNSFLSSMSHDIRTPMNAIIGFTNIAGEHIDDKTIVVDSLEKINSSSSHLLSLINDILDMSKIESGKIQLKPAENDLLEVIDKLTDIVRSQITEKQLILKTDTAELIHSLVWVDELRLNQVLINIIGNAIKYTPQGGTITIKISESQIGISKKSEYAISIRDTGIGMSKDYLPHVFESFTRERTSTVDKIQGTGLGMAISDRLVKLMCGSITAESELGKGTVFTVILPLEYLEKPKTVKKTPDDKPDISFDGMNLLLVEDNDLNAQIATFVLSEKGFTVERCENGKLAVDRLKEKGPDYYRIVLMDIQMPVMNGYEASKAIRSLENADYTVLPIIAMTANTFDDDKKNAYDAGMNDHLAKPFDVDILMKTLAKYVK